MCPKVTRVFNLPDSGLVLKSIHLPREHGQSQEVTLEQLQVFQVQQHRACKVHFSMQGIAANYFGLFHVKTKCKLALKCIELAVYSRISKSYSVYCTLHASALGEYLCTTRGACIVRICTNH